MNGRRAFLSFMGKAAALAPAVPHVISERIAHDVSSGVKGAAFGVPQPAEWTHKLSKKAFNRLVRTKENEADLLRLASLHRMDGCDPDIHCLRSLSPTARKRMQIRRDKAMRDRHVRLTDILWPRDNT